MTKDQLQKIEEAAETWLHKNSWDHQKYGDRRGDRSAYDTRMNYEISDLLSWAFSEGANWALQNLITNHESQTAIRREPIGEDLED